uniref:TIL domain-containing protein n=1 Tax=Panagrellus redivivus TaxID=6233 RepID=A0A7E5A0L2_PANRE
MPNWSTALAVCLALASVGIANTADAGTHVRLVQPLARTSERGFNVHRNAEAPCPTNKLPEDPKNYLKAGGDLEFVWFNPTAVQGSYRLELLNSNYELIATIADSTKAAAFETNGLSKAKVTVPLTECKECVLRLVQTTRDDQEQLLSCADVEVTETTPQTSVAAKCEGEECTRECASDEQCGQGTCVSGSCYCLEGYFGPACARESSLSPAQVDLRDFSTVNSTNNSKNQLFWRVNKDDVELVLKVPTNTWTVLGLRPTSSLLKCPWLEPNAEKRRLKIDSQQGNSLDGFDKIKIQKISAGKGSCGENEVFSKCPEYSRECEASCDWTSFPESIPNCPRACGAPRCICAEGFVRSGNSKNECVPFNVCQEEVAVECAKNETWAKCGTACEPSCDTMYDTTPCTHKCAQQACTCADNYVRHNGECIFWSNCPNLEQRVLAPETQSSKQAKSKSTPAPVPTTIATVDATPSVCGANETLNECGRICEADCFTIFVRDECNECGKPACACEQGFARNGKECVYWGDCPLDASGLQTAAPKTTIDEVLEKTKPTTAPKNGKPGKQSTTPKPTTTTVDPEPVPLEEGINEVVGDVCFGEWRWPRNCKSECDYRLTWNYEEADDEIQFSLITRINSNMWSGVGFSKTGTMKDADFIIVKSHGGVLSLHDMSSDGYSAPKEDAIKNVYTPTTIGTHNNGFLHAQFARKRVTGDNGTDAQFTDDNCYHFLFPVSGGKLGSNGAVLPHVSTPLVSPDPVCFRGCETEALPEEELELPGTCMNEYRFPENCEGETCEYIARWDYNSSLDEITFEIKSRGIGRWTGIGISRDGAMTNSDVYTGWVYNTKAYVVDRFAYGRQLPAIDPADRQDIYDIGGNIDDDYQTIWFTRKITTNDKVTDFPLDKCYYFLFPVGGGRVLARKSQDFQNPKTPIGYHDLKEPKVSKTKICICDEHDNMIADIPHRVRTRRQAVPDPFIDRPSDSSKALVGLPDIARIGQISIAELTGKAKYDVTMDPFACSDVAVIKVLPGGSARVVDAFAHSKYGLEPDEFFGGSQSFTEISASESNGTATVLLKRRLRGADVADHDFAPGNTQVYWANGPEGESQVRFSGAANVESYMLDFFRDGVKPVIADLSSEADEDAIPAATTPAKSAEVTTKSGKSVEATTTGEKSAEVTLAKSAEATTASEKSAEATTKEKSAEATTLEKSAEATTGQKSAEATTSLKSAEATTSQKSAEATTSQKSAEATTSQKSAEATTSVKSAETIPTESEPPTTAEKSAEATTSAISEPSTTTSEPSSDENIFQISENIHELESPKGIGRDPPKDIIPLESPETSESTPTPVKSSESSFTPVPPRAPPTTETNFIDEEDSGEHTDAPATKEDNEEEPFTQIQHNHNHAIQEATSDSESTICHGSFVFPPRCLNDCTYALSWQTDGANVHFQLWTKIEPSSWSGVGFSSEGGMMNADAIIVSVLPDSSVTVTDQWSPSYGRPSIDERQDVFGVSTQYLNGEVFANFSRSLSTTDEANDLNLGECQFFLFMQTGGPLEGGSSEIRKHTDTPISSGSRVCLGRCGAKEALPATPSAPVVQETVTRKTVLPIAEEKPVVKTAGGKVSVPPLKPPTHFLYDAVLRFNNLKYADAFDDLSSPESKKLSKTITDQLGALLSDKYPETFKKIDVLKFAKDKVKSLVRLEFDGANSPSAKEVEEYLKTLASEGRVGELDVDPKELMLKENHDRPQKDEEAQLKSILNWIILIGAVAFLIAVLLCMCCWTFRRRKSKTYPAEPLSFGSPMHKPYYFAEPIYDVKATNGTLKRGPASSNDASSPRSPAPARSHPEETPKGIGEATYQEWYTKVASKDAPSHHQESTVTPVAGNGGAIGGPGGIAGASRPQSRLSAISGSPYVSYPQESGYYTLGGEHRMPPPSYYRQY